ncbi:MAG: Hsp70 family protein [Chloroflexi bacterium]|nr:Hsp70 family protein [Chloroflexota bacterium]
MSVIIGIDLGTTFSATAQIQDGVPQILPHGDERIMPSIVSVTPQNTVLVGTPARNQYVLYPERTVRSIKRKMGQDVRITLGEISYTPQEISAIILRDLKRSAEIQLNQTVDRAVITVPAYFSDAARQATREAGEIAGFKVERIINEPTAAALAYGLDRSSEHQVIAVYDLGGGTFDVSIIELDSGVVEVRSSHGNTELGGDDFDQRLVDFLADYFIKEHSGSDPRLDRRALARLTRAAEQAKIALSSQPFVRLREEYLIADANGQPLHLDLEITRVEFEELIEDLIEGTLNSLDTALKDAGIKKEDLQRILFVGGSTRIPLVWKMVTEHIGLEPEIAINPDEAVALGAAVQAAIIAGEPLDAILVDVTPHSLGIEVAEVEYGQIVPDHYNIIIHRNTTIPTSRSEAYSALFPGQKSIELKIYQGENPRASRNTLLGEFLFEGLHSEKQGEPPRITVEFDFDIDGILHVSAVDRGSGKKANMSVKAARAHLSAADIASARTDLEALEMEDWDNDLTTDDEEEDEEEYESPTINLHGQPQPVDPSSPKRTPFLPKLETLGALSRARRIVAASGPTSPTSQPETDTTELENAIALLEEAIRSEDETATTDRTEELLDLLYDFEPPTAE